MDNGDIRLPKFQNPPVIERVLGVQFEPIAGMANGHIGWFWKTALDESWVSTKDAPPLLDQFEKFGDQRVWSIPEPKISLGSLRTRTMFVNRDDDRLIQVQDTRLVYNWKKQRDDQHSFIGMYGEFENHLRVFTEFLGRAGLEPTPYNQWEMTYVNHVPKGMLWETVADWPNVFSGLFEQVVTPRAKLKLEGMMGSWQLEIPPERGRVHAQLSHGKTPDGEEVLILNLTARGPVFTDQEGWDLRSSMALGHKALVLTFVDLATPTALAHWGVTNLQP
jgi:uncharacterized protein (TIGR04255 family)